MRRLVLKFLTICFLQTCVAFAQAAPDAILIAPLKYPAAAKQARVQGSVVIEVQLDRNGGVEKSRIISGNPVLVAAVSESIKNWEFECRADRCLNEFRISFKFVLTNSSSDKRGGSQETITLRLPHTVIVRARVPLAEPLREPSTQSR